MKTLRRIVCAVLITLVVSLGGSIVAPEDTVGAAQAAPSPVACATLGVVPLAAAGCLAVSLGGGKMANWMTGGAFDKISEGMLASFGKMLAVTLSWWVKVPTVDPSSAVSKVNDYTFQLQLFFLTCTFIWVGVSLIRAKRTAMADGIDGIYSMMAKVVFAVFAFSAVVALGTKVADLVSNWILSDAIQNNGKGIGEGLFKFAEMGGYYGVLGVFFLAFFGFLSGLVTVIMLLIRQAMLPIVQAAAPIAATASGFQIGSESFNKLMSWTIAFLLFKPVGALVYLVAFTLMGNSKNASAAQQLIALILLSLVGLVLPALMKLISSVGGGGGASGMAIGGAIAGVAVQAGLMAATGGGSAAAGAGAAGGGAPMTAGVTAGAQTPAAAPGGGGGGSGAAAPAAAQAASSSSVGGQQPTSGGGSGVGVDGSGTPPAVGGGQQPGGTSSGAPDSGVTAGAEQLINQQTDLGQHGVAR